MLGRGYFYDKKCTISSATYVDVDASSVLQETVIHILIPCSFWKSSNIQNFTNTGVGRQTDIERYFMNLQPQYTDIRKGMQVDIVEPITSQTIGQFIVETVNIYPDHRGQIDNIEVVLYTRL